MTDVVSLVEGMSTDEQSVAVKVLDAVSRPLSAREIEAALRRHGVPKSRAVLFGATLCKLSIIAVVGGEQ
jgi:hypothetical protein